MTAPHASTQEAIVRILIIAPTPFFGDRGCHVRIYEEARALKGYGVSVEIVTYAAGNDVPGITIRRARRLPGLNPSALGPSYARPFLDLAMIPAATQVVARFKPQVLHAHLHEGVAIGIVLQRRFGIPLVADLQGSLTAELIDHGYVVKGGTMAAAVRRLERWLVRQPDALVASSTTCRDLLAAQGADPHRIECLPDGVDLHQFQPLPADADLQQRYGLSGKRVVVFLGVLTEYQGIDALFEAVPEVVRRVPDTHFLVMGYPNEDRYRAKARSMGIDRFVTLPGRIPYEDAARHLSLGTLAVSAKQSLTEANGKLLNYMACGLPVVATDTLVNREILGDAGVYARVGDAHELAVQMANVLTDASRCQTLGAMLRRRAEEQFSWRALTGQLLDVYRRVAGSVEPHLHATRS